MNFVETAGMYLLRLYCFGGSKFERSEFDCGI